MCCDNEMKVDEATYLNIQDSINELTYQQKKIVFDILENLGFGKKENLDETRTNISNQNDLNRESEV